MSITQKLKMCAILIVSFFFGGLKSMFGVISQVECHDYVEPSANNTAKSSYTLKSLSAETTGDLMSQLIQMKKTYSSDELKDLVFSINEHGELVIEGTKSEIELIKEENEVLEGYLEMTGEAVFTCVM